MSETENQILDATIGVVALYGMRKTSVGDIAGRAGVSRQTVYNLFANKEEIYRAAIRRLTGQWCDEAGRRLKKTPSFERKIDILMEVFVIDAFKFSRARPDAHDMFTEAHAVAGDLMSEFFAKVREMIADVLHPYAAQLKSRGVTAEQFADQIETAGRGYKRDARSMKHLRALLAVQKQLILTMTS